MKSLSLSNMVILAAGIVFAGSLVVALMTTNAYIALGGCLLSSLIGGIAHFKASKNG